MQIKDLEFSEELNNEAMEAVHGGWKPSGDPAADVKSFTNYALDLLGCELSSTGKSIVCY